MKTIKFAVFGIFFLLFVNINSQQCQTDTNCQTCETQTGVCSQCLNGYHIQRATGVCVLTPLGAGQGVGPPRNGQGVGPGGPPPGGPAPGGPPGGPAPITPTESGTITPPQNISTTTTVSTQNVTTSSNQTIPATSTQPGASQSNSTAPITGGNATNATQNQTSSQGPPGEETICKDVNCALCQNNGDCISCNAGFILNGTNCSNNTSAASQIIASPGLQQLPVYICQLDLNCALCNTDVCAACNSGYTLVDDRCQANVGTNASTETNVTTTTTTTTNATNATNATAPAEVTNATTTTTTNATNATAPTGVTNATTTTTTTNATNANETAPAGVTNATTTTTTTNSTTPLAGGTTGTTTGGVTRANGCSTLNCAQCGDNNVCTACNDGYYLTEGACISNSFNFLIE